MSHIPIAIRRDVIDQAGNCCEYCLLSQSDIFFSFEIDHIIAEKHGGVTLIDNLCLSCPDCNAYKGSDISSIDSDSRVLTALYNPRTQKWDDHFKLDQFVIEPQTDVGRVTVLILKLNLPERVQDRRLYYDAGSYPCRAE